jgi:prevent-host-death family protein
MKYSEAVKPISYLKSHASEVVKDVSENKKTMIITHNGEAKVILQDVKVYEQMQEAVALLKILALSGKNLKDKKYKPIGKTFNDLRKRIKGFTKGQSEIQS